MEQDTETHEEGDKEEQPQNYLLNNYKSKQRIRTSDVVKLNIGGYKYLTTISTLTNNGTSNNFFSSLFSEKYAALKDDKGYYIVDRNGKYFEPILEYLRTGEWDCPPGMDREKVLKEARFYNIEPELYTNVTDVSLREIVERRQTNTKEAVYKQYEKVFDIAKKIILESFVRNAEEGKDIMSPIFVLPIKEIKANFYQSLCDSRGTTIDSNKVKVLVEMLDKYKSDGKCVFLSLPQCYDVLLDNLKTQHLVTAVRDTVYLVWVNSSETWEFVEAGLSAVERPIPCQRFIWKGASI